MWPVSKVQDRNADFHPAGLEWIKDMAVEFNPTANTVVTAGGQRVRYDFLVVATGLPLDFEQIEGMDVAAIGSNGPASIYPSPQAAVASRGAMQALAAKGGEALMTLPAAPLKCAGAPQKMTFMLRDRLQRAGGMGQSKIHFESALGNVFGVQVVNEKVLALWKGLGIDVDFSRKLTCIDTGTRRARFDRRLLKVYKGAFAWAQDMGYGSHRDNQSRYPIRYQILLALQRFIRRREGPLNCPERLTQPPTERTHHERRRDHLPPPE